MTDLPHLCYNLTLSYETSAWKASQNMFLWKQKCYWMYTQLLWDLKLNVTSRKKVHCQLYYNTGITLLNGTSHFKITLH